MTIEKVSNGYIVSTATDKVVHASLLSVFEYMLLVLEGKSKHFGNEMYGKVVIEETIP